MATTSTRNVSATLRRLTALAVGVGAYLGIVAEVGAQEILMTGPLAGAPAVRKLRLYREGRFELAPAVSFTLLDEYQRTILIGAKLNYNLFDWLAIGVWGGFGAVRMPAALTEHIQDTNAARNCQGEVEASLDCRLTAINMGPDLRDQVAQLNWVAAPQLTVIPFRGKINVANSLYADTDLHLFLGPAFVGTKERADCDGMECTGANGYTMKARTAFAPMFGLGLSFFTHEWGGLAVDWRAIPFSRNTAGFDTAGGGPDKDFPDLAISEEDRQFKFNQLVTVSYSIFFPFELRMSE